MKQPEDTKTFELSLPEAKRGRGRPAKPDALTPAERAKRYRDAKRAGSNPMVKSDVTKKTGEENDSAEIRYMEGEVFAHKEFARQATETVKALKQQLSLAEGERNAAMQEIAKLQARTVELQWKLDRRDLALVEAQNKLAAIATTKPPVARTNPLAKRITELERALETRDAEHSAIMQAMQAEHQAKAEKQRTSRSR